MTEIWTSCTREITNDIGLRILNCMQYFSTITLVIKILFLIRSNLLSLICVKTLVLEKAYDCAFRASFRKSYSHFFLFFVCTRSVHFIPCALMKPCCRLLYYLKLFAICMKGNMSKLYVKYGCRFYECVCCFKLIQVSYLVSLNGIR